MRLLISLVLLTSIACGGVDEREGLEPGNRQKQNANINTEKPNEYCYKLNDNYIFIHSESGFDLLDPDALRFYVSYVDEFKNVYCGSSNGLSDLGKGVFCLDTRVKDPTLQGHKTLFTRWCFTEEKSILMFHPYDQDRTQISGEFSKINECPQVNELYCEGAL